MSSDHSKILSNLLIGILLLKDKGESVRILFDPKDGSIEFDNFYRLYKTPSWLFGMLMLLWFMLFYILRSL